MDKHYSISDVIRLTKEVRKEKVIFEKQIEEDGLLMNHNQIKLFYSIYRKMQIIDYYESRKLPPYQYGVMI